MACELLKVHCKKLKLGGVPRVYDQINFQDREQYLTAVLDAELEMRRQNRIKKLLKKAAFTNLKTLKDFDFQTVILPESTSLAALTDLVFLEKRENVLMLGAVGTGKTHLATALGVKACMQGTSVRFFRSVDLANTLLEKHKNGSLARYMRDLRLCELLILDEVGFVPLHRDGAELLFNVVADCYERCSVIVTSNLTSPPHELINNEEVTFGYGILALSSQGVSEPTAISIYGLPPAQCLNLSLYTLTNLTQ